MSAVVAALGKVKNAFVTFELRAPFAAYVRAHARPRAGPLRRRAAGGRGGGGVAAPPAAAAVARARRRGPRSTRARVRASPAPSWPARSRTPRSCPWRCSSTRCAATARCSRSTSAGWRRRRSPPTARRYLNAIGYFRAPELVEAALAYVLDGPLRPQEIFAIPCAIATTVANDGRTWEFLAGNYPAISAKLPPMFLAFMPHAAGGCSVERAEKGRVVLQRSRSTRRRAWRRRSRR